MKICEVPSTVDATPKKKKKKVPGSTELLLAFWEGAPGREEKYTTHTGIGLWGA